MQLPFVEKYNPKTIDDLIGPDHFRNTVKSYIESDKAYHIIFHGPPGVGKTSAARLIINSKSADYLYINASTDKGIDTVRDKIFDFVSFKSINGSSKIVFMEEADALTFQAQESLRNVMDIAIRNSVSFIITCNRISSIYEPIISRCSVIEVVAPSKKDVLKRILDIVNAENISYNQEDLKSLVLMRYPDIRACIQLLDECTHDNKFVLDSSFFNQRSDLIETIINLLKTNKNSFTKIRELLSTSGVYNFDTFYRDLYNKSSLFGEQESKVCLLIAEWQYKSSQVPDKEINFMGMMSDIGFLYFP